MNLCIRARLRLISVSESMYKRKATSKVILSINVREEGYDKDYSVNQFIRERLRQRFFCESMYKKKVTTEIIL